MKSVAIIIIAVVALLALLYRLSMKQRVDQYESIMVNASSIYDGLEEWSSILPAYAFLEREAINMALNYLEFSFYRDYKTAFVLIEKHLRFKRIREVNKYLLDKETKKAQLLLTQ